MSLLLVALAGAAAPATYHAAGNEPFWRLDISRGRIRYNPGNDEIETFALPRRQLFRGGYRYVTRRHVFEIRHVECVDNAGRTFADTVTVGNPGRRGEVDEGCGGTMLTPYWLGGTSWRIIAIDGRAVGGANYHLAFEELRLSGQAGCNRFSAPYQATGTRLSPGPVISSRMACPPPRMDHERRALGVLGGPMRVSFPNDTTLVITGRGHSMRLRKI